MLFHKNFGGAGIEVNGVFVEDFIGLLDSGDDGRMVEDAVGPLDGLFA